MSLAGTLGVDPLSMIAAAATAVVAAPTLRDMPKPPSFEFP